MRDHCAKKGADYFCLAHDFVKSVLRSSGFAVTRLPSMDIVEVWKTDEHKEKTQFLVMGSPTII
jgi:hypothetical protein